MLNSPKVHLATHFPIRLASCASEINHSKSIGMALTRMIRSDGLDTMEKARCMQAAVLPRLFFLGIVRINSVQLLPLTGLMSSVLIVFPRLLRALS